MAGRVDIVIIIALCAGSCMHAKNNYNGCVFVSIDDRFVITAATVLDHVGFTKSTALICTAIKNLIG